MKKLTIFAGLLLFTFTSIFAQNLTLESVCKNLSERPNTTGDFVQTKTIQANGRKLTSSGKFILSKLGIMWKTEKPFPSSLILTEDSMVQIAANGKKSVMSGKDNQIFSNISSTLSSVFSGDSQALMNNFVCDFSDDGKGNWAVKLSPKDSTIASVMKILVLSGKWSENSGAALDSLELAETSGNSILYEFKNQKYPKELSADEKQNFVVE